MLYVISVQDITDIPVYFKVANITFSFSINLITMLFAIALIYGLIILAGISVFGSGLSDSSVQLLSKVSAYIIIWVITSFFSLSFLLPLEVLGQIIYVLLSFSYTLGFLQSLSLASDE